MSLEKDFLLRVKALVFTDSFYHSMFENMKNNEKVWAASVGIHFKRFSKAQKPLGEPFKN